MAAFGMVEESHYTSDSMRKRYKCHRLLDRTLGPIEQVLEETLTVACEAAKLATATLVSID